MACTAQDSILATPHSLDACRQHAVQRSSWATTPPLQPHQQHAELTVGVHHHDLCEANVTAHHEAGREQAMAARTTGMPAADIRMQQRARQAPGAAPGAAEPPQAARHARSNPSMGTPCTAGKLFVRTSHTQQAARRAHIMTPAAKPSEAATTLGVAMRTQNTTLAPTDDAAPAPITCSGQPVSNGSHASGSEACARHCGGCC